MQHTSAWGVLANRRRRACSIFFRRSLICSSNDIRRDDSFSSARCTNLVTAV